MIDVGHDVVIATVSAADHANLHRALNELKPVLLLMSHLAHVRIALRTARRFIGIVFLSTLWTLGDSEGCIARRNLALLVELRGGVLFGLIMG